MAVYTINTEHRYIVEMVTGRFSTLTFRPQSWSFRPLDGLPPGRFATLMFRLIRHLDESPPGRFATRTVRHLDDSPPGRFAHIRWTIRPPPNSTQVTK